MNAATTPCDARLLPSLPPALSSTTAPFPNALLLPTNLFLPLISHALSSTYMPVAVLQRDTAWMTGWTFHSGVPADQVLFNMVHSRLYLRCLRTPPWTRTHDASTGRNGNGNGAHTCRISPRACNHIPAYYTYSYCAYVSSYYGFVDV